MCPQSILPAPSLLSSDPLSHLTPTSSCSSLGHAPFHCWLFSSFRLLWFPILGPFSALDRLPPPSSWPSHNIFPSLVSFLPPFSPSLSVFLSSHSFSLSSFPPSHPSFSLLLLLPYILPPFYSSLPIFLSSHPLSLPPSFCPFLPHLHYSLPHGIFPPPTVPTLGSSGSAPEDPSPQVPPPRQHNPTPTPRGGKAAASQLPWPAASPTR